MTNPEQLSSLIERIYDAALDSSSWPDVLQETCAFLRGCTANLFYQDSADSSVTVFYSWGEDPYYRQLYIETYAELNPLFPASSFLEVGAVHTVGDMVPLDEFRQTRLYREWVQPQGILDVLYSNLERTATGAAAIAVRRWERDGLFDPDAKARFALIIPHVRRAVSIGKVIDFHKANEVAFSRTLDGLSAGVVLVAADRTILYANEKAEAMFAAGDLLRAPQGRLAVANPKVHRELQEAVAAAARGDTLSGTRSEIISLTPDQKTARVVHVLPLTSDQRRATLNSKAVAALFVGSATFGTPSRLETLAKLYRLTASEVRVLAALAEGGGVTRIATALGVSEATVKTHLHHLFVKTGTTRQAELVKLLALHRDLVAP